MNIDEKLRAQSKLLLQKLKARQGKLQQSLDLKDTMSMSSREESLLEATLSRSAQKNREENNYKGEEVDLDSSTTATKHDSQIHSKMRSVLYHRVSENKENLNSTMANKEMDSKSVLDAENENTCSKLREDYYEYSKDDDRYDLGDKYTHNKIGKTQKELQSDPLYQDKGENSTARSRSSRKSDDSINLSRIPKSKSPKRKSVERSKSPNTVARRRKIIDQNVKVDSKLNDSDLEHTLNQSGLNYSYSNMEEGDCNYMRERMREECNDDKHLLNYTHKLEHSGNDKNVAKMIRESQKPKSILSSGTKSLRKSLGKVSFLSSKDGSSFNSELMDPNHMRQLLGYDWIAALLDNNQRVMNHSEAYFEELREFRRLNREECQNQFYMEGPESLFFETTDKEPITIKEVLEDKKVKPYVVNDRLFTVPIKKSLFPGEEEVHKDEPADSIKPTFENPRFVRVSIPRSTLASPYRMKPHRRKSLEGEDSMALSQHCQMGYESSVPSMVPAASNLGLKDASHGIKSKMETTMADAEKTACSFPYPWNTTSASSSIRQPAKSDLYSSYADMTLPHSMRSNVPGVGDESLKLKRATEDLLNSTYSLMYEMENMKRDRELQNSRLGRM